jgi:uncharacterized membrane protein
MTLSGDPNLSIGNTHDPLVQGRLAKGEITPEQYQASLKVLQGS